MTPAVPPPTVVGETFATTEDAAAADFEVLSNDTPAASGDTLTITDVKSTGGTATITNSGTRLNFVPKANVNGQTTVIYTVRSSNGGLANGIATFTITAVNDAPDAVNDTFSVLSSPLNPVDQAIQQVRGISNTDDLDALTKKRGNSNSISNGYR